MIPRTRFIAMAIGALALAACSESQIPTEATSNPQAGLVTTSDDPSNVSLTVDGTNATVDYDGAADRVYKINFACASATSGVNVNGRPTDAGVCASSPGGSPQQTGPGPVSVPFTGNAGNVLWACVRLQDAVTNTENNSHPWHCAPGTPYNPPPEVCPEGYVGTPPDCVPITNDVEQLVTVESGTKVYGAGDWTITAHTNAPIDLLVGVSGDGCEQVGDATNAPATGGGTDATITLHVLAVGSCTVEAGNTGALVGNDNWLGASAQGEWTITPADLTVTTDNKSCTYGDATPTFTGTISTVYYSDGITASWSSSATCQSPVSGSPYAIVATVNDPNNKLSNYNLTATDGTLLISPRPIVFTADNKGPIAFMQTVPACTWTNDGNFAPGESLLNFTGAVSCTSPVPTAPGTYSYVLGGNLTNSNYNITLNNGTLTVVFGTADGFLEPLRTTMPDRARFKQGSTIPAKFRLIGTAGPTDYFFDPGATLRVYKCSAALASTCTTVVFNSATTSTPFFRWAAPQEIYNWNTEKNIATGIYKLVATLSAGTCDGTSLNPKPGCVLGQHNSRYALEGFIEITK